MKKHGLAKGLSLLLVLCLVLSLVPMSALADETENTNAVTEDKTVEEDKTVDTAEDKVENGSFGLLDWLIGGWELEPAELDAGTAGDAAAAITIATKPDGGTTTGNPFLKGTGGSNSFRIPAMVTLNDGTIVAAADARWNTTYDGGGLDTIVSYSKDGGASWNYSFANYLGDNGNVYNGSGSTAFIDPALATDGETVYMLCDLYPYGVALNGSGNTAPSTAVGFDSAGHLLLSGDNHSSYGYYLDDGKIYSTSGVVQDDYAVDAYFNITGNGYDTNLFFSDSPFKVVRTGYLYLTTSSDSGKSWSEPVLIPNVKTSSEQVCLVAPGRGLVLADGDIVFPVYSYNGSSTSQKLSFIHSSNKGETWTRSDKFTGASWSSESAVVELNDGTLRFFFRNGNSKLYYVDYTWGTGWGSAVNTGIATNSNTQISAISYSKTADGKQVILVSCPTGYNNAGSADSSASARLNGKIFVGYVNSDNTMSWQSDKAISVTSNNNQFMYSCLTELSDGKVAILYEDGESKWGTGDDCYYTMSFKVYNAIAGLVQDNVIKDATGVQVNFGAEKVTGMTVTTATVAALEGKTYVAYDITPSGYTGSAKVTIPLTTELKSCANLMGFVVETDGIKYIPGTRSGDSFTFTTPHFSTVGVVKSSAPVEVSLVVDEEKTLIDDTGYYVPEYTGDGLNKSVADVNVTGEKGQEENVEYIADTSVTCNDLIDSNSSTWQPTSKYYTPDGTNFYPLYATRSGGNYSKKTYTWAYLIDGEYETIKSQNSYSVASPNITVYTQTKTEAITGSTTITFTGVSAGTTSVVVGETLYNITVDRKSKTVNLSVGDSATFTDSGTLAVADSTVVSATLSGGTLTITGLKDGTTTVTTDTTVYTVTVSDGTPISIKENETTTISVTLSGDQYVKWSSADSSYVGVAGKYDTSAGAYTNAAILAGQNVTGSPVVVTGTVYNADGTVAGTNKWLVTVTAGDADTNTSTKGIYFNISTIEHCTVYYSINGGELIPVNGTGVTTGNWTGNGTHKGHFNIMFFAAPEEGYALTYMSISGSDDQYYTLTNGNPDGTGSDAWPFDDAGATEIPETKDDDAWKSGHGFRWALLEGNMTIDQMKVMFSNAIALGCDGATTITKNANEGMGSASSPTVCKFVAQQLPTVEKTIKSITHKGTTTAYTDGMKVEIGDTITYSITVTRYATSAAYGTITYDNEKLIDELTNNNGISTPDMGTSTTSDKTYTYTSSLLLTKENFATAVKDGKITNTVDFSYSYSSQYSAGSLISEASAVADITVEVPSYVIDFGLPVTLDLSTLEVVSGKIQKASATYGKVTVSDDSVTYTPTKVLLGIDYINLELTDGSYAVAIYPATTVYYEEGFAALNGFTVNVASSASMQAAEIAGEKKNVYGYDSAYNAIGASNGTQATSNGVGDNAVFTFTGTGVDIYANCTTGTGRVLVLVRNSSNSIVKLLQIDTATGAAGAATQGQAVDSYSLPIASISGLDHGKYTVTVQHTISAAEKESGPKPVYLDGFRVYDTLKEDPSNSVYISDGEANPSYTEVRNSVLASVGVGSTSDTNASAIAKNIHGQVYDADDGKSGALVLTDTSKSGITKENAQDLLDNGPKNELFLYPGQTLTFTLGSGIDSAQIGLKAVNESVTYQINAGAKNTLTSSTDMFYPLPVEDDSTVIITNVSGGILSVTDLKWFGDLTSDAAIMSLDEEELTAVLVHMGYKADDVEEPEVPEEPSVPAAPVKPAKPDQDFGKLYNKIEKVLKRFFR